jgi:hypothetical protein
MNWCKRMLSLFKLSWAGLGQVEKAVSRSHMKNPHFDLKLSKTW